jgi:hypothetical protein
VSNTDRTIIVVGDANDAGDGGSLITLRRTGAVFNAQIAGTTTYLYTDGVAVNITAPNVLPTVRSPFTSVHRVSAGTLTVDINGETKTSGAVSNPENGATGFTIGSREDFATQRWNGDIAEMLVFNRNLSSGELAQINAYLNQKYGLSTGAKTELDLGPTTHYFRHDFQFNGDPSLAELRFIAAVDDGAVFYLNGQEIHRQNMPAGTISYNTLASSSVEPTFGASIVVPAGILHTGTNVLAVEVHQAIAADPDMDFDMSMTVTISPPAAGAARALVLNEVGAAGSAEYFV